MKTETQQKQMELSIEARALNRNRRAKRPSRRSQWWFRQMRQVVDRAIEWSPRPTPRAHQVYFSMDRQAPNW
ncbi:MAG TPA: hypothetical protein VM680_10795 [Verrucomicrobiae bacterium]|nr:hypothetical protein [Verrucomicrobiae bacterium]